MKKTDVLYGFFWVMFIGGVFFVSVGIEKAFPISIISLASISIFDWVRLKKKNEISDEIHFCDFKMLYCEVAVCLASLFVFIWEMLHDGI